MEQPEAFTLTPKDLESWERALEQEWRRGRAFVPGRRSVQAFAKRDLVLSGPDGAQKVALQTEVIVALIEQDGVAGTLVAIDDGQEEKLEEFAQRVLAPPEPLTTSVAPSPMVRLNELSMHEKLKLARTSPSLTERTALERLLDRSGWDALLSNPALSPPEVAKIARKGTVPRPIIERIVSNSQWSRNATVRRALLSNPKMTRDLAMRVLRKAPKHELKLVPKQTAYPAIVRTVAREIIGKQ